MARDSEPRINESTNTSGTSNSSQIKQSPTGRPDHTRKGTPGTPRQSGSDAESTDGGAPSRQTAEASNEKGQL